jgi:hypothetical protein
MSLMNIRTLRPYTVAAALVLLAGPLSAQRRPHYDLSAAPPAVAPTHEQAVPAAPIPSDELAGAMSRAGVSSGKSTLGNAALIASGLGVMYLAYSEGEEGGGGFGTFIGVLGAASFWGGIIRQFFYRAD